MEIFQEEVCYEDEAQYSVSTQTDGKTKRTIHTLEDMLRAFVINFKGSWSPVGWFEVGESSILGPEIIHEAVEKVRMIRDRLATASVVKNLIQTTEREL